MKNRLPIILLFLLGFALLPSGCGESVDNPATAPITTSATATQSIPFVPPLGTGTAVPPKTDWNASGLPPAGLPGLAKPHVLTEAEKAEVLRIALEFPVTANWLKGRTDYQVIHFDWCAVMWTQDGQRGTDYWLGDYEFSMSGVPNTINPNAYWYPGLTMVAGDGNIYIMQIAVDLSTGKIALADGPYPPPGTPGPPK